MVALPRCPVCKRSVDPAKSQSLPFCSPRCRQIDLGRWLGEAYSVPVEREADDEEAEGGAAEMQTPDDDAALEDDDA